MEPEPQSNKGHKGTRFILDLNLSSDFVAISETFDEGSVETTAFNRLTSIVEHRSSAREHISTGVAVPSQNREKS